MRNIIYLIAISINIHYRRVVIHLKELFDLIWIFAKIGALTFGGGYAMLPILQREIVEKKGWATEEELLDYFAISQCTPGVIAVNTATFIGNKRKGVLGGILATIGLCLPSIIIITIIAALTTNFAHIPAVQKAFGGIRVCVAVLIINAVMRLFHTSVKDMVSLLIFITVFLIMVLSNISPALIVLASAIAGCVIKGLTGARA